MNRNPGAHSSRQGRGTLVSVGYEGRDATELTQQLGQLGVSVVADVRLNAISRKRGFSKTALRGELEHAGIDYVHLPALGNPRDNRDGFRAGSPAAHQRYQHALAAPEAVAALDELVALLADGVVAVICVEADHEICHRSRVIAAIRERMADLTVVRA